MILELILVPYWVTEGSDEGNCCELPFLINYALVLYCGCSCDFADADAGIYLLFNLFNRLIGCYFILDRARAFSTVDTSLELDA